MTVRRLALAAVLAALALPAAAADGAYLFATKCAMCHGSRGKGASASGQSGVWLQPIAGIAPATTKKLIAEGRGKMLPVAMKPEEADAIATYLAGVKLK